MNQKMICNTTGKVLFWTEAESQAALDAIASNPHNPDHYPQSYYPCDHCVGYHLSSWTKERYEAMLESKRRNGIPV